MQKSFPLPCEAPETEEAKNFCCVLSTNLHDSEGVGHLQNKRTVTFPLENYDEDITYWLRSKGLRKSLSLLTSINIKQSSKYDHFID